MSVLWPESDTERARALLRDSLYRLREALGDSVVVAAADDVSLDTAQISCDVCEFEEAVSRADFAEADRLYTGAFLEGFFLSGTAEFERWVETERARLATMHAEVLESLAAQCTARGELLGAVTLWRRRASEDPYNSRVALQLIEALDAAGDRAGALHYGAVYAKLIETEFGAAPDASITEAIKRLRSDPSSRDRPPARAPAYSAPLHVVERQPALPSVGNTPPLQVSLPQMKIRSIRKPLYIALPFVIAFLAAAGGLRRYSNARSPRALESDLVAVLPFRVMAPDSSHNYLREGIVDLVGAQLTGSGAPRVVDTRTVDAAYKRAVSGAGGADLNLEQSIALARSLGANQLMIGELVSTPTGAAMSVRLVGVPSGRVLAEHAESGGKDELILIGRVTRRLLAKRYGEGITRISGLSDSTEAVRAYLAGMRAYRKWEAKPAFDHFGRALDIDPTFVAAALWRAYVSWGAFVFATEEKRRADSVAWSLRKRVGQRDSLLLASLPSIGPNWPQPSTADQLLSALEGAARANPDRPEVWQTLARHLEAFGKQAGIPNHFARAIVADDSAIVLDSSFAPAIGHRVYVSVLQGDTASVRRFRPLLAATVVDPARRAMMDWMVARALRETESLPDLLDRFGLTPTGQSNAMLWSIYYNISSLEETEHVIRLRYARANPPPNSRSAFMRGMMNIASQRGQPRRALAFADSLGAERPYFALIELALVGPGYDSVAQAAIDMMKVDIDTIRVKRDSALVLCYVQLWNVTHRDTVGARLAANRLRALLSHESAAPAWDVGRLGLCSSLIDGAVSRQRTPGVRSEALNRVEGLLLRGILTELPGNVSHVIVARWLEADGKYAEARTVLRHIDPMSYLIPGPESWRMIGRLSARLGDTESAIDAYQRFLAIRHNPEPGPYADQVREARAELARLGGKEVAQYHVFKN